MNSNDSKYFLIYKPTGCIARWLPGIHGAEAAKRAAREYCGYDDWRHWYLLATLGGLNK